MLKISWMDRMTDKEVIERIPEGKLSWKNIVRRRNEWIGHLIRHEGLLKLVKEKWEGKNQERKNSKR